MIRQRWIVLLDETKDRQIWLGYDALGRIGNARFDEAFRYDTRQQAYNALMQARRERRWPNAEIFGVAETVESDE